jgi:hypothetical protein
MEGFEKGKSFSHPYLSPSRGSEILHVTFFTRYYATFGVELMNSTP